ncbi:MFS transporter [Streptomyces celluloflavus]|uniref:MFS transporter n=1 Tax=Streptomyces celluloflavus TaxID=58344 RepID=UPI00367F477F
MTDDRKTAPGAGARPRPLWRNRDYNLLWMGRAFTDAGFNASLLTFPLLVLAVTGSPAQAGLVTGVNSAAQLIAGVPAGTLLDRWNRRTVMLCCEVARTAALGLLVWSIWRDTVQVWHMLVVAAVLGLCAALYDPAEEASLPHVVPGEQLATAVAMNHARSNVGQLLGTALSGVLFGIKHLLPFAANAVTHVLSFFLLLFVRLPKPAREQAEEVPRGFWKETAEGLRWVWGNPLIRVTALCAIALNFLFQVVYLVIIMAAQQDRVPAGQIGMTAAMFGAGGILGALAAPRLYGRLGQRLSVLMAFWAMALLAPLSLIADGGLQLGLILAGMALFAPTANTAVSTYQLLATPDRLRGRLSGILGLVAGVSASLGPVVGGLVMEWAGARWAIVGAAAGTAVVAVVATLSRTLRGFTPGPDGAGGPSPAEADGGVPGEGPGSGDDSGGERLPHTPERAGAPPGGA